MKDLILHGVLKTCVPIDAMFEKIRSLIQVLQEDGWTESVSIAYCVFFL
jgi:hypothetical protein